MKTFICLLGLAAVCAAGVIESKGSEYHGSSAWQPSNAPSFDYSNFGNGHSLAGQGQDHQALTQHDAGSLGHEGGQVLQFNQFNHGGQGNDLTSHGQAKSFDIGHGAIPSFGGSGHDSGGDSYLQAAHDFGSHGAGQGDFSGHDGGYQGFAQGYESGHGGEGQGDESNGYGDAAGGHHGGGGQTQAIILHDGGNDYGHGGQDSVHDLGAQGWSQGFGGHGFQGGHAEPFSVGEHTDEEHPVEVPQYKHVTVPVHKHIQVNVPKPILIGIPQPYPVKVPVNKPVAVPVETEISIPIEKVVPYPVVKHVPYPVEKHVPYKVEKTVHVHVPQPYPVKIPIYKTIHHHKDH